MVGPLKSVRARVHCTLHFPTLPTGSLLGLVRPKPLDITFGVWAGGGWAWGLKRMDTWLDGQIHFLIAYMCLFKSLCQSVGLSVGPSIGHAV